MKDDLIERYSPDSIVIFGSSAHSDNLNNLRNNQDIDIYSVGIAEKTREVYIVGNNYAEVLFNTKKEIEDGINSRNVRMISMFRRGNPIYDPEFVGEYLVNLALNKNLGLTSTQLYSFVGRHHNMISRIKEDMIGADRDSQVYMAQWIFNKIADIIALQQNDSEADQPKIRMTWIKNILASKSHLKEFAILYCQSILGDSNDPIETVGKLEKIASKLI